MGVFIYLMGSPNCEDLKKYMGMFIKDVRFFLRFLEIPTYLCPIHYVLSIYVLCPIFLDIPTYPKIWHPLWTFPKMPPPRPSNGPCHGFGKGHLRERIFLQKQYSFINYWWIKWVWETHSEESSGQKQYFCKRYMQEFVHTILIVYPTQFNLTVSQFRTLQSVIWKEHIVSISSMISFIRPNPLSGLALYVAIGQVKTQKEDLPWFFTSRTLHLGKKV